MTIEDDDGFQEMLAHVLLPVAYIDDALERTITLEPYARERVTAPLVVANAFAPIHEYPTLLS